jgi:hypothetical protein
VTSIQQDIGVANFYNCAVLRAVAAKCVIKSKVKLSLLKAMEAHRVARG